VQGVEGRQLFVQGSVVGGCGYGFGLRVEMEGECCECFEVVHGDGGLRTAS